ncbi:MAG: hypothetical protein HGB11_11450 [Chlorobiales bacterium]|nr:hypothetical protein [Chlorobiales bacterium]
MKKLLFLLAYIFSQNIFSRKAHRVHKVEFITLNISSLDKLVEPDKLDELLYFSQSPQKYLNNDLQD